MLSFVQITFLFLPHSWNATLLLCGGQTMTLIVHNMAANVTLHPSRVLLNGHLNCFLLRLDNCTCIYSKNEQDLNRFEKYSKQLIPSVLKQLIKQCNTNIYNWNYLLLFAFIFPLNVLMLLAYFGLSRIFGYKWLWHLINLVLSCGTNGNKTKSLLLTEIESTTGTSDLLLISGNHWTPELRCGGSMQHSGFKQRLGWT